MPGFARSAQIDVNSTPYYHCISRCVRRAFLCGEDRYTGKSFDHRKLWLLERLRLAASVFSIDICAYAIMSNHFHLVLRIDAQRAAAFSDEAVLRRYGRLFRRAAAEVRQLPGPARARQVAVLRKRLASISWFMRCVSEYVARRANKEDEVTGRFWEGRFKCQALLDEPAVLTCMSYVDLNPIRASMAETLRGSTFTSIRQRITDDGAVPLAPLFDRSKKQNDRALPVEFSDYVELLEWTRLATRGDDGAAGRRQDAPSLVSRRNLNPEQWLRTMTQGGLEPAIALGSEERMAAEAARLGQCWLRGKRIVSALFNA